MPGNLSRTQIIVRVEIIFFYADFYSWKTFRRQVADGTAALTRAASRLKVDLIEDFSVFKGASITKVPLSLNSVN